MPEQEAIPATEKQDLGIAKLSVPDQQWARMQPMFIQPSKQRLDRKHQLVSIKNTSDVTVGPQNKPMPQKHVVIDRFNQGHELMPGETKHNIDMLTDDIEYFIRERRPDRQNHLGQPKPLHPIQIIGFDPDKADTPSPAHEQPVRRESVQREKAAKET